MIVKDREKIERDILELGILFRIENCINMSSEDIIAAILNLPKMKKLIKEEELAMSQGLRVENIKETPIELTREKIIEIKNVLYYCIEKKEKILLD